MLEGFAGDVLGGSFLGTFYDTNGGEKFGDKIRETSGGSNMKICEKSVLQRTSSEDQVQDVMIQWVFIPPTLRVTWTLARFQQESCQPEPTICSFSSESSPISDPMSISVPGERTNSLTNVRLG